MTEIDALARSPLTSSSRLKPKRRIIRAAPSFMEIAPAAATKVIMPDWKALMP